MGARARIDEPTDSRPRPAPAIPHLPSTLLALQRTAGNRAVAVLIARCGPGTAPDITEDGRGTKRPRDAGPTPTPEPPEKKSRETESAGRFRLGKRVAAFETWESDDDRWHFTYFLASGDYHLKGNKTSARAYQKGWFSGSYREDTGNKHKKASGPVIAEGQAVYLECMRDILPRYAGEPTYRGPHA